MGGKSKPTIGYWFFDAIHYGLAQSIDALLEIRGDGNTAWQGRVTANGTFNVNAPDLYGGPQGSGEGGVVTDMDVMFGDDDQLPNAYLDSVFGPPQTAHRGKATLVIKGGKTGAKSPYPKGLAFLVERFEKDWEAGVVWYPERVRIPLGLGGAGEQINPESGGWRYLVTANGGSEDYSAPGFDDSAWAIGASPFSSTPGHPFAADVGYPPIQNTVWPLNTSIWIRGQFQGDAALGFTAEVFADNFATAWINGSQVLPRTGVISNPSGDLFHHQFVVPQGILVPGTNSIVIKAEDYGSYSYIASRVIAAEFNGFNPAHMLYDSLVLRPERGGQGEPVGLINNASFTAGADKLYAEGFGLCTEWKGDETAEQFQNRILDIIAAALSQGADGLYYLDLIRDDYDFAALPIFTETDILEFSQEPTNINEAVNRIIVEWNDPVTDEDRATAPMVSLGAVQAAGGVISETITHREIPSEGLALRVAARELRARATPLSRFNLTTNRRHPAMRKGQFFRLQKPSEGIADMVCLLAEVDRGNHESGRMKFVATQAVFGMPDTVYVDPSPGVDTGGGSTPQAPANQRAFEAPYIELARRLSAADLAALADDSGFLATVATPPTGNAINYSIFSAAAGEAYVDRGTGDWCPSAIIVEAAPLTAPLPTVFTFTGGSDLNLVEVGNAALWDDEIARVDAINIGAGTITLGRGCADTTPAEHAAGTRLWIYHDDAGTDAREYVDGEIVNAKLLTRTLQGTYDPALAAISSTTMAGRAARPYPPGRVRVEGVSVPASVSGVIDIAWAHRDRVLQADQLIDHEAISIGPAADTRYALRFLDALGALLVEKLDIAGASATATLNYTGTVTAQLYAINDAGDSWQRNVRSFDYTPPGGTTESTITATTWTPDEIIFVGGGA